MNELIFNAESLKLLDILSIPSMVIYEKRMLHFNGVARDADDKIFHSVCDKSYDCWDEERIDYIRISQSNIRIDIKRSGSNEYMILKINYNKTPCYLVITNIYSGSASFKDCINYFNNLRGIEKIMVVDDDPLLVQTYSMILELLGYQSFIFTDPVHAHDSLESLEFDLLISDYNMPEVNGRELLDKLVSIKPYTPVIICSGTVEIYKGLFNSTCAGTPVSLISKPVTIKKISEIIEVMEFITKICSFCRDIA